MTIKLINPLIYSILSYSLIQINIMSTPVAPSFTLAHFADLDDQPNQTCGSCGKSFKKLSHFNRHLRESHSDSRDHICREEGCGKSFKRGSHLKRHMISHSNQKKHRCGKCIMSFGYKHHLDRHVKVIHLRERLECQTCGLQFIKRKAFNRHNAKAHPDQARREQSCKTGDLNASTKMPLDESRKHEDIYDSGSEWERGQSQSQKLMFRCHHQNCLSAFYGLFEFNRHLTKIHPQIHS